MRRAILIAGIIFLILLFFVPSAIASDRHQLTFPEPVWVNGVLLPAGEYDIRHFEADGKQAMEFVQREAHSPARVRVACLEVKLEQTMLHTQVGYRLNEKGERVLTQVAFGGESVEHRFAQGRRP